MPKPKSFPIDKIYVPVKTKKARKPELLEEIAESILEIGKQAPILVRPERPLRSARGTTSVRSLQGAWRNNYHRRLGLAEITHQKTLLSHSAEAEAERDKMARLKKLRLEKEAAAKLAAMESAEFPRERSKNRIRNNPKASRSQIDGKPSGSTPKTLWGWLTQQKRDGGRY